MRGDEEFDSYALARWPTLVRCVRMQGAGPRHAVVVTQGALRRLHRRWSSRNEWFDLDVELYRDLVAAWAGGGVAWWREPPGRDELAGSGFDELAPALDRLDPSSRWALVLEGVAGLDLSDVAEIVHAPAVAHPAIHPTLLLQVAQAIGVGPAQIAPAVAADEAGRRRRRTITAVVVGGVLAVVAAYSPVAFDYFDRSADEEAAPPRVVDPDSLVPRPNTVPDGVVLSIPWYVEGRLRLGMGAVDVGQVTAVARVPVGAIVQLRDGSIVRVRTGDGQQTLLGSSAPGSLIAASSTTGWSAWITPGERSELVVFDEVRERVRVAVGADEQVVAVDGRTTYLAGDDGYRIVRSGRPVTSVPVAGLLDVAAGVRLVQEGGLLRVLVRPGVELTVSGEDARLSDTGEFMVASVPVDGRRRLDTEVLDVASGVGGVVGPAAVGHHRGRGLRAGDQRDVPAGERRARLDRRPANGRPAGLRPGHLLPPLASVSLRRSGHHRAGAADPGPVRGGAVAAATSVAGVHRFRQVDVFSRVPLLGNPVAVVHDADDLTDEQMAAFARWTNLSETTFLLRPDRPGGRLPAADLDPRRRAAVRRAPDARLGARLARGRGRAARTATSCRSAGPGWCGCAAASGWPSRRRR